MVIMAFVWKKRSVLSLQDRRFLFDALPFFFYFFYKVLNGFIDIGISPFIHF